MAFAASSPAAAAFAPASKAASGAAPTNSVADVPIALMAFAPASTPAAAASRMPGSENPPNSGSPKYPFSFAPPPSSVPSGGRSLEGIVFRGEPLAPAASLRVRSRGDIVGWRGEASTSRAIAISSIRCCIARRSCAARYSLTMSHPGVMRARTRRGGGSPGSAGILAAGNGCGIPWAVRKACSSALISPAS